MTPMVSIIMPVYGVEKYVGKSIESLQNQTFRDWELLAVDDGTKDRSGEICDEYAAKDPRITVFHKENGGAPSARNYAMPHAKGKYYYFMDSDDWVEPTMLEDMVRLSEEHDLELLLSGFYIDTYYDESNYLTEVKSQPSVIYESAEAFHKAAYALFDNNLLYTPWNKLFLKSYIDERSIRFRATFWDDFPFVMDTIYDVARVGVTSKAYYHFVRARAESETSKYRPGVYEKRVEEDQWMQNLYHHWGIDDEPSREMIARRYVERLFGCVENLVCVNSTLSKKAQKEQIREILYSPRTRTCLREGRPRSFYMKVMWLPLRWRSVWLTRLEGCVISHVKSKNTKKFAKLKANR